MPKNTRPSAADRGGQPRVAEQLHVQRRVAEPGLVPGEEGQHEQARRGGAEHVPVDPGALLAALDDAVHHQHQAGDGQQHAEVVDPARARVPRLGHEQQDRDHADRGERDVDQEDRAPPEVGEQQAADDRADGHADAHGGGPDADGPGPLPRVEHVGDDRQRLRHDRRGAQAHRRPGEDELIGVVRVRGEQREQAERGHADHQHALAADPVADHAEGEQQAGEHQRVGVDRPTPAGSGWRRGRPLGSAMVLSATFRTVLSSTIAIRLMISTPRMTQRRR